MKDKVIWEVRDYGDGDKETVSVYKCECGRSQRAAHPESLKGVSPEAAQSIGWEWDDVFGWHCPHCTGALSPGAEDTSGLPPPRNVKGTDGVWRGIP